MRCLRPTRGCSILRRGREGQHLAEYAIIIGVAAAAAIGMQTYVKRAIQAKIKGQVDYWLNVQAASLSPPQECVDNGITDPAKCTQAVGMMPQDVTELVSRDGANAMVSNATRTTQQQTVLTYTPGVPVSAFTSRADGTSFRVTGAAVSLTKNSLPPDFVRRPQLPNGVPTGGGGLDLRSSAPPVPEVSGSASAQRAAEFGRQQQRRQKKGANADDEEDSSN